MSGRHRPAGLFGGRADPGRVRANGRAGVEGRLTLPEYDERLTVQAPKRVIGGVTLHF